jgi:glycosyltransferase involved in cell wall biosynthesis
MACGLPVVSYELPYMKSIFTEGIITVPCYNTAKFAEAVKRLLSQPNVYSRISKAAKKQAKHYDWERVAHREYQLFKDLIGA